MPSTHTRFLMLFSFHSIHISHFIHIIIMRIIMIMKNSSKIICLVIVDDGKNDENYINMLPLPLP